VKYGLADESIQKIQAVLATFPQIEKAVIFGSRVKGNYKKGSDIDLTLQGAELTTKLLHKIEDELDDLLLPYKIDLSVFDLISDPDFMDPVLRVGQVFYEKKSQKPERMETGWEMKKLGDLCFFENGDRGANYPSKSHRTTEGIPFINAGHLTENGIDLKNMDFISRKRFDLLSNGKIQKGDILFCLRGSLGKFSSVGELLEGAIASSLVIVRPSKYILHKYLLAYFQSQWCIENINHFSNGAAQPNLSAQSLSKFIIPVPPLPEQQRIVSVLDEAFTSIAQAKANAERNLVNVRELFENYKQSTFKNSGNGWEWKTVGDMSEHSLGKMLDKQKNRGKNQKYLRNASVRWFEFNLSDVTQMRFLEEDTEKYTALKGDLLICEGGYPGRAAIWQEDYPIFFQKAIHRVRFHQPEYTKWFLYFLNSSSNNGNLKEYLTGTGIQHFTGQALDRFVFPVPPVSETRAIVARLDALSAETKRLEEIYKQKLAALDELKKSILQKAFAGEL
jgi:type I restriction enzyme S subunit